MVDEFHFHQFEAICNNASMALFILDGHQRCAYVNPAGAALTGFALSEIKGRPLHDLVHRKIPNRSLDPAMECPIDRAFPKNHKEQGEEVFVHKDGHLYDVAFTASPIHEAGEIVGTVVEIQDITARKRSENDLRESEARFRAMADNIAQLAWIADKTGWIFWYNRRWFDYTGTTLEEMQGWGWQKVHHPDHVDRVTVKFRHHIENGQAWEDTFPLRGIDGKFRWFLSRAFPIRDDAGIIIQWFGTNTDITKQRDDEEALRESEERYRILTETVPQLVWTTGADGSVDYFNDRWYTYTKSSPSDILGWGWIAFLHADDLPRVRGRWLACLETGDDPNVEYRLRGADGSYRWFRGNASAVRDGSGSIIRWIGTSSDIDEQKHANEELRSANRDLEQFAYVSAHDLQEPLRMITQHLDLIQTKFGHQLGPQPTAYLTKSVDAAVRMRALINDLLAYSRIGRADPVWRSFSAREALDDAIADLLSDIDESKALVTIGDLPPVVGSRSEMTLVFQNLISNALKYHSAAHSPRIEIAASRIDGLYQFTVTDNGIGIDPRNRERIFEVFQRLHSRAEYPGSGIGLALCLRIVERHRGRIWVTSQPGQGSEFHFTWPANEQDLGHDLALRHSARG
ncbi:MAG: PAS domain S-box protein [Planctomycetes bacterium]|nr:PAS domain S-box protein [Planctomycetota bacterium]